MRYYCVNFKIIIILNVMLLCKVVACESKIRQQATLAFWQSFDCQISFDQSTKYMYNVQCTSSKKTYPIKRMDQSHWTVSRLSHVHKKWWWSVTSRTIVAGMALQPTVVIIKCLVAILQTNLITVWHIVTEILRVGSRHRVSLK